MDKKIGRLDGVQIGETIYRFNPRTGTYEGVDFLDYLKMLLNSVPQWQRSRFVDHHRYSHMPEEWKEERRKDESRIIRGPGIVGTAECNVLFRVDGPHVTEEMMEIIANAELWLRLLVSEIEARRRPGGVS